MKTIIKRPLSYLFMITMIIASLSTTSCKKEKILSIGQEHAGGIIISLDETMQHGLIMSKEDISEDGVKWEIANSDCQSYNREEGIWRLPTGEELTLIYQSKDNYNLAKTYYWSSTSKYIGYREYALAIDFNSESMAGTFASKSCKYTKMRARPVKDF